METIDLEEKFHDKEFATALKDEEINVFTAKDKLSDTLDGVAQGKRKIFSRIHLNPVYRNRFS